MSDTQSLPGPLAGLRALELADEKGQFCGKLLGDLGADVIKIEPPGSPGGDAVALIAGVALGGTPGSAPRRGIAMMQNSGLGNAVSPLTS